MSKVDLQWWVTASPSLSSHPRPPPPCKLCTRLVKKVSTTASVQWRDSAVLVVEKKVNEICALDYNVCVASGGLTSDARIVINRARVECQSHWLTGEDPVRYIASLKQSKHKQRTEAIWHLCPHCGFLLWWHIQTPSDWPAGHTLCLEGQGHRLGTKTWSGNQVSAWVFREELHWWSDHQSSDQGTFWRGLVRGPKYLTCCHEVGSSLKSLNPEEIEMLLKSKKIKKKQERAFWSSEHWLQQVQLWCCGPVSTFPRAQ